MELGEINDYQHELFYFCEHYLFHVMGLTTLGNNYRDLSSPVKLVGFDSTSNTLRFGSGLQGFEILSSQKIDNETIEMGRQIIQVFNKISVFSFTDGKKINNSFSRVYDSFQKNIYSTAVERGICEWAAGSANANSFESLLNCLELWSTKTYEGHKVPFAIVYCKNVTLNPGKDYGTFLDFLKDEYAAVFSDCISSAILVDSQCNFIKMSSLIDGEGFVDSFSLENNLPYRFAHLISSTVKDGQIGLFLLTNGDIIISKEKTILMVKRNSKWLNYQFSSFENSVISHGCNFYDNLLRECFASSVDVTFTHTGGIIALIDAEKYFSDEKNKQVLSDCDNLKRDATDESIFKDMENSYIGKNAKSGINSFKKVAKNDF